MKLRNTDIQVTCQIGFSLIEVLVSVVLLTTSLVGVAALQSKSMRFDHQALLRSQSVLQVSDMVDRMRANETGVAEGRYYFSTLPASYPKDCSVAGNHCSPEELAIYDVVVWNEKNAETLPGGFGSITDFGAISNHDFKITVNWQEQSKLQNATSANYVNRCGENNASQNSQHSENQENQSLRCHSLMVRL